MRLKLSVSKDISLFFWRAINIYFIGFYFYQLEGLKNWFDLSYWFHVLALNLNLFISPEISSSPYFLYFLITLSFCNLILFSRFFAFLTFSGWILFLNNAFLFYTPQEEFLSLFLLSYVFSSKDKKIDGVFIEFLFFALAGGLGLSAYHKFSSPAWFDGYGIIALVKSPLTFQYVESLYNNLSLFSWFEKFINWVPFLIQGSALFLIIPHKQLRKTILTVLFVFFSSILFILNLPSIIFGMLLYIGLLYYYNEA